MANALGHSADAHGTPVVQGQQKGTSMSNAKCTVAAISMIGALITSQANAEPADSAAEIALLKKQLKLMEEKLDRLQKQTSANAAATASVKARADANAKADAKAVSLANANAVIPVKGPMPPPDALVHMPNNRPTICTADGKNCVSITSRVHFDGGGYDYHPNSPSTNPQKLDNGVNVRRARIGVLGKFFEDWNYALIYDFGGSSDGFGGTAAVGPAPGTPVGFLPGGATSGIENAYLSYTGLKPFGGKMALEVGIMDVPYTLDEATSSNDIVFMERASSGLIAQNIAAGDFRSAVGTRWYTDTFWLGGYVTGPTTGAVHSASSIIPNGMTEQVGAVARAAGQIVSGNDYSVHLGADAQWLIRAPRNQVTGAQTLTLSDRPELRIDPTTLISTGALAGVSGAQVYSVEAAATFGPLFLQGEYFWFNVDRQNNPVPLSSVKFEGGYAQAAFALTGETRKYNPASASYGGIVPKNPFTLDGTGWGAWEVGGRVSMMDLNNQLGIANGVAGGRQLVYTVALNWYVNRNVRFMLDYLHGNVARQLSPTNFTDAGSTFDAFAMRTQVAF
jgi:phosphate-selective porin OprO and OprP